MPFVLKFRWTSLTRGRQEFLHGNLTGINLTHTSTPHPVRPVAWALSLSLILYQQGPSESEIRRRLTAEGEEGELVSIVIDPSDDFTETRYLLYGLDLEQQQYVSVVSFPLSSWE